MSQINRLTFFRHLRADPNQYILHYRAGRLIRQGVGLAYWFNPLSAAVAQVPVEDIETTFILRERSADFQEVTAQLTLTYRIADPERAAQRINFSISLESGAWIEQPLQRLNNLWSRWAQHPTRSRLIALPLAEAVQTGAEQVRAAVESELRQATAIAEMGLTLVSVQVDRLAPTAELEKALQAPTREAIQQKADEATFQRRAMAVENERAIKENELETEIELARQQEELIRQQGDNKMLDARQEAERERFVVESEVERSTIATEGNARQMRIRGQADADARRMRLEVETEAEARRVELWRQVPASVTLGLALQQFAGKIEMIEHLNLSPNLLGDLLQQMLLDQSSPN
jgi:hypothetical protein